MQPFLPLTASFCFTFGAIWSNSGLFCSESGQMDSERRRGESTKICVCIAWAHVYVYAHAHAHIHVLHTNVCFKHERRRSRVLDCLSTPHGKPHDSSFDHASFDYLRIRLIKSRRSYLLDSDPSQLVYGHTHTHIYISIYTDTHTYSIDHATQTPLN